jgi:hypothetical protein
MEKSDLKVGRVYRAKHPKMMGIVDRLVNDRSIVWMGETQLQYDSPSVAIGRKLPRVSIEAFLKWAGKDVTELLPEGKWAESI